MATRHLPGQTKKKIELTHWEKIEFEAALPTYRIYQGMKLHFNPAIKYDWHHYGGADNLNVNSMYKARGRIQLLKLHKKFERLGEEYLIAHLAANFIHDPKMWLVALLSRDATQRADEYRGIIENFRYKFQIFMNDNIFEYCELRNTTFMELIKPPADGSHSWLLKGLIAEKLPWWFVIGLNRITSFVQAYDKTYAGDMFWPTISDHIKNIQGFYVFDHESTQHWLISEIKRRNL